MSISTTSYRGCDPVTSTWETMAIKSYASSPGQISGPDLRFDIIEVKKAFGLRAIHLLAFYFSLYNIFRRCCPESPGSG